MARKAYARRYSQAVFEIAIETNSLDRWHSDLRKIVLLAEDVSLTDLLQNPKLSFDFKAELLAERLGEVNLLALNLVHLLVTRGRVSMAGDIAGEYQRLLDSHRGIERAEVTTAMPLDDEDQQRLAEQFSAIVGKKVVLKSEVDPGIVGGIMARIGGKLIDGSIRSQLMALKRELVRGGK